MGDEILTMVAVQNLKGSVDKNAKLTHKSNIIMIILTAAIFLLTIVQVLDIFSLINKPN